MDSPSSQRFSLERFLPSKGSSKTEPFSLSPKVCRYMALFSILLSPAGPSGQVRSLGTVPRPDPAHPARPGMKQGTPTCSWGTPISAPGGPQPAAGGPLRGQRWPHLSARFLAKARMGLEAPRGRARPRGDPMEKPRASSAAAGSLKCPPPTQTPGLGGGGREGAPTSHEGHPVPPCAPPWDPNPALGSGGCSSAPTTGGSLRHLPFGGAAPHAPIPALLCWGRN